MILKNEKMNNLDMKYKEEDEEVSKEIDQLNIDIENKLKLEIKMDKNLEEAENFIKNNNWKILVDKTLYFQQNIERIWDALKTLDFLFNINNSPFLIKKGSNIWEPGNIFEGKIFDIYEFNSKVIKQKLSVEYKKIEWIFFLSSGDYFRLKMNLYKVTEDNTTVINIIIKSIPSTKENILNKIKEKIKEINYNKRIKEILQKESVYLYQYESGQIHGNIGEIWDLLTDYSKLSIIAPNNRCFVPININNVKIGDISNIPIKINNIQGYLEIKLDLKEKKVGWNEWVFGYSILGGGPFKTAKQTFYVKLTKINKSETQLCMFTKIYEKIPIEMCKILSQQKNMLFLLLKIISKIFQLFKMI